MQPLAWVEAVERLVEEQDRRVVDQRAGQLGPLAHALGVGADRPVGGVGQVDRRDRPARGRVRIGDALEPGVEPREAEPGQVRVDGLALRHEPDVAVHLGPPPSGRALDEHATGGRREQAGHQVSSVDLPAPLGPSRPVTPGPEGERDVVDGHDVAVPARDVVELERRMGRGGRRGRIGRLGHAAILM